MNIAVSPTLANSNLISLLSAKKEHWEMNAKKMSQVFF